MQDIPPNYATLFVATCNLLNLANYSGGDANVNSPTFGQIRSVTGQRRATLNLRFGF